MSKRIEILDEQRDRQVTDPAMTTVEDNGELVIVHKTL
jgi:hypothetical protein